MNQLDSYQIYLARKSPGCLVTFYNDGKLSLEAAQSLAQEHVNTHPQKLRYFVSAGILPPDTKPDVTQATFFWNY